MDRAHIDHAKREARTKFETILARVRYKDWTFHVGEDDGGFFLQVRFLATDPTAPHRVSEQRGRKWRLSRHMTPSEIVQTALAAVLAAEEHEAREAFTYRDCAVYGPHFDVERLVDLCREQATDARPALQI